MEILFIYFISFHMNTLQFTKPSLGNPWYETPNHSFFLGESSNSDDTLKAFISSFFYLYIHYTLPSVQIIVYPLVNTEVWQCSNHTRTLSTPQPVSAGSLPSISCRDHSEAVSTIPICNNLQQCSFRKP